MLVGFKKCYGHKINLSTEQNGLITYLCIEMLIQPIATGLCRS